MDGFTFYIDDLKVEQPDKWEEFTEELKNDTRDRVLYFSFPLELNFYGNAYNILNDKWQQDYNSTFKFVVFDNRSGSPLMIVNAVIKLTTCVFNLTKKTCECNIDDATYQAQIFENLDIEIEPSATTSKNGVEITPCTNLNLETFNPTNGGMYPGGRTAYDLMDCIRHAVQYLSDGNVDVESTWYDNLPDDERIAVMTGANLQNVTDVFAPIISIKDMFQELWRKFNLYMIVENPLKNSVIRIESTDYLYDSSEEVVIKDIKDLSRSMDYDQLYNRVKLGSQKYIRDYGNEYLLPYYQFFGFSEESYTIKTDVAVNQQLDLSSKWIIDHNVIQAILTEPIDTYEDDIILVQYDKSINQTTKCYYLPTSGGALYNEAFLNSNVADRFDYYGDLILDSGIQESGFRATRTTSEELEQQCPWAAPIIFMDNDPYPYNDDTTIPNYDDGNNYDPNTYLYTAPSDGVYRFESSFTITFANAVQTNGSPAANDFSFFASMGLKVDDTDEFPHDVIVCTILDNTLTIQSVFLVTQEELIQDGIGQIHETWYISFSGTRTVALEQGQTVQAYNLFAVRNNVFETGFDVTIVTAGLLFRTLVTPGTGGEYEKRDENGIQIGLYDKTSISLTADEWDNIRANPTSKFILDTGNNDPRISYAKTISRKLVTGETDIETTFNRQQPFI